MVGLEAAQWPTEKPRVPLAVGTTRASGTPDTAGSASLRTARTTNRGHRYSQRFSNPDSMQPRRSGTLAPGSHRKLRQRVVAPVHPALPLPRLSCSRWCSLTLLCLFRPRSDSGLSFVDQSGLEDGSSRPLDRLECRPRARNLQYIVNNSRFLILPWVQVKALASTILARSARQVPHDWRQHYGYMPLLLETLVDVTRFKGTCYRAANWIALGETTGRGKMDRHHKAIGTLKRIFVLPLHRRVKQRLCATDPDNVSLTNAD